MSEYRRKILKEEQAAGANSSMSRVRAGGQLEIILVEARRLKPDLDWHEAIPGMLLDTGM